jgi:hypothetical protein
MKYPVKAIEHYLRVVDFAILDKNDETQKEPYQSSDHYPRLNTIYQKSAADTCWKRGIKEKNSAGNLSNSI